MAESETGAPWKGVHFPNLRLNLRMHLGWNEGWELDLIKMFGARSSTFTKNHEAVYHDFLIAAVHAYVQEKDGWEEFTKWLTKGERPYVHYLFGGSPTPKLEMPDLTFALWLKADEVKKPLRQLCRDAENQARTHLGLPAIVEGWVSETELFRALAAHFSQTEVMQHGHPHFLGKQHYDVWFPCWNIAVEFHGGQHFEAVEFFGGKEAFLRNVERDQRKSRFQRTMGCICLL